jgi:hypothetical protein
MEGEWSHKIFKVNNESFEELALDIFRFQYYNNSVYRAYCDIIGKDLSEIRKITQIPFLPVSFFKSRIIITTEFVPQAIFESSGTTGSVISSHYIKDLALYEESFRLGFEKQYGQLKEWCILGLLPSYLERKNSSLVYMVDKMIQFSEHPQSGFYLNQYEQMIAVISALEKAKQKTLLLGVTFALLDLAEKKSLPLKHTVIMETGGMKGRRKEMIREEVHQLLQESFSLSTINSEYGMTELLSQAYSKGNGIFNCPPWMKVLIRDDEDPFTVSVSGAGTLNIIDLANIYSCSFIATDDAGRLQKDGSFEVLGRIDGSDLRGCSLLTV